MEEDHLSQRGLEAAPDDPEALGNLGVALTELGRLDAARSALSRAVSLRPDSGRLHYNLGNALWAAGRLSESIAAYRQATLLAPDCGEAWCNLGVALRRSGQLADAVAALRRAAELLPHLVDVRVNLGVALDAAGRRDDAIAAYRDAIAVNPKSAKAHYNLGNALSAAGDLDAAVEAYQAAIGAAPRLVAAHCNLGIALTRLGRHAEAMNAYDRANELDPTSAMARWNRSLSLLLQGDYAQGWPEYEWRNRLNPPSSQQFPQPLWIGQGISGKTLLLHAEHGLGDTVQFVRYVPLVAERKARLILRCQPELHELLRDLAGVDQLVVEGEPLPTFDVHCPLMSLPNAFRTGLDSIPSRVPYLLPDPRRVLQWEARLAHLGGGMRAGLVWAGRPKHQYDAQRSVTLSMLAPLARAPGVRFFSLQKGDAAEQACHPPAGMELLDFTHLLADYADTAALISQLDLVISVDTSVAHVAGAMGKPVWLLLAFAPDWRWLLSRSDSPWYPSMRLFRQTARGQWADVIHRVAQALTDASGVATHPK